MKLKYGAPSSKDDARAAWKKHFENRSIVDPPAAEGLIVMKKGDDAEILILEEIGFWGVTAKSFNKTLAEIGDAKTIKVRISSPGGDVFDAMAIYNALKTHKAKVTTVVEGIAASAASVIMMAGDTIDIHENAMVMIHRAWTIGIGNTADFLDTSNVLAKLDGQIADMYAAKTSKASKKFLDLMTGEVDGTWFTAAEAKDEGLVDNVISNKAEEEKAATARAMAMRRRLEMAEAEAA